MVHALDVEVLGLRSGSFDGQHLEGADLGQDVDEAGVEMAADAGVPAIFFPVVVGGCLEEIGF